MLAAQERQRLADEVVSIAGESVAAFQKQIAAGAAPEVEAPRAEVALGQAQIEQIAAARALETARAALAASWGGRKAGFARVEGTLETKLVVPDRSDVLARLGANPALARWETEQSERQAALSLEQARAVPDVVAGVGGRYFSDNGDAALVVGVYVPLPVFDRNQGAIEEARVRIEKVRAECDATEVALRAELSAAYDRLRQSSQTESAPRERILPQAESSLVGSREAFRLGRFRYLDVLDAQRTLFALRADYLRVLEEAHLAAADIERLTASPLQRGPPTEVRDDPYPFASRPGRGHVASELPRVRRSFGRVRVHSPCLQRSRCRAGLLRVAGRSTRSPSRWSRALRDQPDASGREGRAWSRARP